MGWRFGPNATYGGGINIAPGEPGLDTSSAGALLIGDNNATSLEIGAPMLLGGFTGVPAGSGIGSTNGTNLVVGGTNLTFRPNGLASNSFQLVYDTTGALNWAGHLIAAQTGGPPATSNLGTNVTSATFTGNDVRGKIVIVMSGALAANTRIATCTWITTFGAITPLPQLINQTSGAGLTIVNFYSGAESATAFDLFADQALASGTYTVRYINIA